MVEWQSDRCAPTTATRTLVVAGRDCLGRRQHFVQRAELEPGEMMKALRQIREHEIGSSRAINVMPQAGHPGASTLEPRRG